MINTSKSDSREQQDAECYIANAVEEMFGCHFERNVRILLADGVHIEPDLYSEDEKIICEIYSHIGALKGGQKHKIAQDILKMLLLEKSKAFSYRKIMIVVDDKVKNYLRGQSFIAESIRQFDIEVEKIDLPKELADSVSKAQRRQNLF
ncbi:MAG: hypothetical protein NC251_04850 [Lachnoclostridium sp.]|nr:hypothetical protein [Lachnospira sp.]MCM1247740.1 hypothetical protein [Lachnoclostridium sp.]MCM1534287.1 hypothetical protein [Clostridium sp.]